MISVLDLSLSYHGLAFTFLFLVEARAYLEGDGAQKIPRFIAGEELKRGPT